MSDPINELAAALVKAQAAIQPALKDKTNPAFRSRYADLTAIWDACREALTSNGLCVIQMPHDSAESGRVALTTILLHTSGQQISTTVSAPLVKQDAQGVGSALTYLRRYSLAAMVGVVTDDDDDGNAASKAPKQAQSQAPASYERPAPAARIPSGQAEIVADDVTVARDKTLAFAAQLAARPITSWPELATYLNTPNMPMPTTVGAWRDAYKTVQQRANELASEIDEVPA